MKKAPEKKVSVRVVGLIVGLILGFLLLAPLSLSALWLWIVGAVLFVGLLIGGFAVWKQHPIWSGILVGVSLGIAVYVAIGQNLL